MSPEPLDEKEALLLEISGVGTQYVIDRANISRLRADLVRLIARALEAGIRPSQIVQATGLSRQTVYNLAQIEESA